MVTKGRLCCYVGLVSTPTWTKIDAIYLTSSRAWRHCGHILKVLPNRTEQNHHQTDRSSPITTETEPNTDHYANPLAISSSIEPIPPLLPTHLTTVSRCLVRAMRDLLSLAISLEIPQLAHKCEHLLVRALTPATAPDILAVAMQQPPQQQSTTSHRRHRRRLGWLLGHTLRYMSAHWDLITCAFPSLALVEHEEPDHGDAARDGDGAAAMKGQGQGLTLASVLAVVRELASTGFALSRTSLRRLKQQGAWSKPSLIKRTALSTTLKGERGGDVAGGGTGATTMMSLIGGIGNWLGVGGDNGAAGDVEMNEEGEESDDDDDGDDDDDDDPEAEAVGVNGALNEAHSDLEEEFGILEDSHSPWTPPLNPRPPAMTGESEPLPSLRDLTREAEKRLHAHKAAVTAASSKDDDDEDDDDAMAVAYAAVSSSDSDPSPSASAARKKEKRPAIVPKPVHNAPLLHMSKYESHGTVVVGQGTMLVVGGRNKYRYHSQSQMMALNMLDDAFRWERCASTGFTMPTGLVGHVTLPLQAHKARHVLCVGGRHGVKHGGVAEVMLHNDPTQVNRANPEREQERDNEQVLVLDALSLSWSSPPVLARSKSHTTPFHTSTTASVSRYVDIASRSSLPTGAAAVRPPTDVATPARGQRGDGNTISNLLGMNTRMRHTAVVYHPEDFNFSEEGDSGGDNRDRWQQPLAEHRPLLSPSSSLSAPMILASEEPEVGSEPGLAGPGLFSALLDMDLLLRAVDPNELAAIAAATAAAVAAQAAATEPPPHSHPLNDASGQGLGPGEVGGVQGEGEDDDDEDNDGLFDATNDSMQTSLSPSSSSSSSMRLHNHLATGSTGDGSGRSASEPALDDAYVGYAAGTELSFDLDYQGLEAQRASQVTEPTHPPTRNPLLSPLSYNVSYPDVRHTNPMTYQTIPYCSYRIHSC